jgi:CHAD domain-containing protein
MTTVHDEREIAFEGTGIFDPRELRTLPHVARVRKAAPEELDAVHYDTADLRLARRGITLRRRRGGHDAGWHVKLPAGQAERTELQAPPQDDEPAAVPRELARQVAAYTRGAGLVPVAHLHTHRRRYLLLDRRDRCLAEVALDDVAAQTLDPGMPEAAPAGDGATSPLPVSTAEASSTPLASSPPGTAADAAGSRTRITQWSEIEVELAEGDARVLRDAARGLDAAGWRPTPFAHKVDRALADELAAARAVFGPEAEPFASPKKGSAGEAVLRRLTEQRDALLHADPGTRADEPDALHRMRSAARRLRNALRAHRRVLDRTRTDPVARELKWLIGELAAARDHEVLAERLPRQAARLCEQDVAPRPALAGLAQRVRAQEEAAHDAAWRSAVHVLDGPRYFALLDALDALVADPPLGPKARRPAAKELRKAAGRDRRRLAERLSKAEHAVPGTAREQALHGVRKAVRRYRHTAETALPYGGKRARRLRKHTKALQQLLGEHQDAVIARTALVGLADDAHREGAATFGYGLLHAAERERQRAARERLPKAGRRACSGKLARLA